VSGQPKTGNQLKNDFRYLLHQHIKENATKKEIFLDRINGYYDHVHCLISLSSNQSIEKVIQLIKGESSFWFNNKSGFNATRLEWQDEYFAVSVSESNIDILISRKNIIKRKLLRMNTMSLFLNSGLRNLAKAGIY
jgi:REP element-mobilizing transposase RayT